MLNIRQFKIYALCFAPALMPRWRDTALGEPERCEALWVILTCGSPPLESPFKGYLKKKSLSFEAIICDSKLALLKNGGNI